MLRLSATWLLLLFASNVKLFNSEETRVRYDGTQLWRVDNINNLTLLSILEQKYGAQIWAEHMNYMDVVVNNKNLNATHQFLEANDIQKKVLNTNIQHLIDEERLESSRTKRSALPSKSKSGINWKKYHGLKVIYGFLEEVNKKYPNITSLYTIGKTSEGRELKVLSISDDPENHKKIWIDGGIHAREWITPAAVTYILNHLISKWQKLPWYFMPVVNPDGYDHSRTTDRLWRKNRSKISVSNCIGVDLNRNFPTSWSTASNDPCSKIYRGPAPASELETKAVIEFLQERKSNLISYLTFHSFSEVLYYPYAYKNEQAENYVELLNIGKRAAKRIKKATGKVYTPGQVFKLSKTGGHGGTAIDWSYSELGVKYTYTMELRDKGKYGFLLPAKQIIATGMEALIFVKTVAEDIN